MDTSLEGMMLLRGGDHGETPAFEFNGDMTRRRGPVVPGPSAPPGLYRWKAIEPHLGVSVRTAQRWFRRQQLLSYQRTVQGRRIWYSTPALLHAWERQEAATVLADSTKRGNVTRLTHGHAVGLARGVFWVAAAVLGLNPSTLRSGIKKLGLRQAKS